MAGVGEDGAAGVLQLITTKKRQVSGKRTVNLFILRIIVVLGQRHCQYPE